MVQHCKLKQIRRSTGPEPSVIEEGCAYEPLGSFILEGGVLFIQGITPGVMQTLKMVSEKNPVGGIIRIASRSFAEGKEGGRKSSLVKDYPDFRATVQRTIDG